MTEIKSQPVSLEDISADLLNGTMIILLGCAFAGIVAWQIIAQLTGWLPDLKAMTADLPQANFTAMATAERRAAIWDSVIGAGLIIGAFGFIERGVRHIRKNLALLSSRRS